MATSLRSGHSTNIHSDLTKMEAPIISPDSVRHIVQNDVTSIGADNIDSTFRSESIGAANTRSPEFSAVS